MSSAENHGQHSALVLEDDQFLASALTEFLEGEGWQVEIAGSAEEGHSKLADQIFDLVLADYLLPDGNGLSVFEEIQTRSPLTKVMLMTGLRDVEVAAQAFRKGAADFIAKPFEVADLGQRIDRLMEERRLQIERERRKSQPRAGPRPPQTNMIGNSPAIMKVVRVIELVAPMDATVLITGESGTGKEVVARAIHSLSTRKDHPFVPIDCGAIPENLLEDEMFGHVPGAYTDARFARTGKFEQANGGMLFLDEIGNMPLSLQVKLLRVLQERSFGKLGSNQRIEVNIRVVAATNCDLPEKIAEGEFRSDLFYRLNVVPIHLPPLRERKEDLPLLANFFLDMYGEEYPLPRKQLAPGALTRLMEYSWPGNIRELSNALEMAYVLSGERTILTEEDFELLSDPASPPLQQSSLPPYPVQLPEEGINLNHLVNELEKNLIFESLRRTGGNKGKAARLLYLKRTTLVEKLRRISCS